MVLACARALVCCNPMCVLCSSVYIRWVCSGLWGVANVNGWWATNHSGIHASQDRRALEWLVVHHPFGHSCMSQSTRLGMGGGPPPIRAFMHVTIHAPWNGWWPTNHSGSHACHNPRALEWVVGHQPFGQSCMSQSTRLGMVGGQPPIRAVMHVTIHAPWNGWWATTHSGSRACHEPG